ncbi:ParB/RepB/Spo0J family partition protein [Acuticoccus yangtzensis]|uniref:ParB/RepB/Spo0J family partition protein n=1 Tax=Acuticoccus yangtzensis TaxID=1443441 RepID=UPI000ABA7B47|nr:ParB N-terminal domain-containing protein [Acuticoccus yangtzensis]
MAKRKRLTPARFEQDAPDEIASLPEAPLAPQAVPEAPEAPAPAAEHEPAPETKSFAPMRRRPPIAGVAGEAAAIAALNEMGQGLEAARAEGRLLLRIPLDDIDASYLVRDRIAIDEDEMEALKESLRRRGQQTAIEVVDLGEPNRRGRWGLISGSRRITALRRIGRGDVLAAVRRPETARNAYQAMVEENEIRAALSFYERARIAVKAAEAGAYPDARTALAELFAAASRARRSKIGSFIRIVEALDGALSFPRALTERQGLALAKVLDGEEGVSARIRDALQAGRPQDAAGEAAILASFISPRTAAKAAPREEELRPGLVCRETETELVLRGPALSEAVRDEVRALLRAVK